MIFRCPHCQGACSLPEGMTAQTWACPRCAKPIPADCFSATAAPVPSETKPARRSGLAPDAAKKPLPKEATKPVAVGGRRNSSLARQVRSGPSEVPTPVEKALCDPAPRWPRRLMTLTCLVLSVSLLASSAGLAIWKVRKKGAPPPVAQTASEARETPLSQPVKPEAPPSRPEELYGGIEIGSKGIKSVVVRLRESGNQGHASELAAPVQTANTTLVTHLREAGILDPDALRDTVRVVGSFHERLRRDHQLPPERIYIIASSGLFASIQDKPEQIETNSAISPPP